MLAQFLMWSRFISYFRIFKSLRSIVRIILETLADVLPFLIIIFVLVTCITYAYMWTMDINEFDRKSYSYWIFEGYRIVLGKAPENEGNIADIIFMILSIIIILLLVNMLLAIMRDSYSRMKQN